MSLYSERELEDLKRMAIEISVNYINWLNDDSCKFDRVRIPVESSKITMALFDFIQTMVFGCEQSSLFKSSINDNVLIELIYTGGLACDFIFKRVKMTDRLRVLRDKLVSDDCTFEHPTYGDFIKI